VALWDELTGQAEAIAGMRAAAAAPAGDTKDTLAHSWLITGPPGSGRSTLAYAFAAAIRARVSELGE
jgi:DNA polymerase-3 subunit delta'